MSGISDLPFWERKRGGGPLTEVQASRARLQEELATRAATKVKRRHSYIRKSASVDAVDGSALDIPEELLGGVR